MVLKRFPVTQRKAIASIRNLSPRGALTVHTRLPHTLSFPGEALLPEEPPPSPQLTCRAHWALEKLQVAGTNISPEVAKVWRASERAPKGCRPGSRWGEAKPLGRPGPEHLCPGQGSVLRELRRERNGTGGQAQAAFQIQSSPDPEPCHQKPGLALSRHVPTLPPSPVGATPQ